LPWLEDGGNIVPRSHPLVGKESRMPLFSFEGKSPRVHPTAFIAPTANLIGDVSVEENASVC
jgi:UDP-3-O-[3-hydroxymyristoyl] glucosamine N-acyltransferase